MRFLFCGLGSIGERHLSNLILLGEKDIIAYRKKGAPIRTLKKKVRTYFNLAEAIKQKPTVAFITNPTSLHVNLAIKLARYGCHLFIEKPLSSNLKNITKLQKIVKNKKISVKIGFMMRYHPAIKQIKYWLEKNTIGKPISIRTCWGEFLPSWHPWEDYSKSYSAEKKLGGGPINTLCHDIDLVSWLFGQPESVFCLSNKLSSLKISTEHNVGILFQFKNKLIAEIHLDYLQFPPKRTWEIIGDNGKIEFDYYKNMLTLFQLNKKEVNFKSEEIDYSGKFEKNDMFIEELKTFIDCIEKGKKQDIELQDGINNLKILSALHLSAKINHIVNIKQIVL